MKTCIEEDKWACTHPVGDYEEITSKACEPTTGKDDQVCTVVFGVKRYNIFLCFFWFCCPTNSLFLSFLSQSLVKKHAQKKINKKERQQKYERGKKKESFL